MQMLAELLPYDYSGLVAALSMTTRMGTQQGIDPALAPPIGRPLGVHPRICTMAASNVNAEQPMLYALPGDQARFVNPRPTAQSEAASIQTSPQKDILPASCECRST